LAQVKREINREEFIEWLADYEIEPWGEERADRRAIAQILYTTPHAKVKPQDVLAAVNPWREQGEEKPKMSLRETILAFNANMKAARRKV
jgi:hypothetical protein